MTTPRGWNYAGGSPVGDVADSMATLEPARDGFSPVLAKSLRTHIPGYEGEFYRPPPPIPTFSRLLSRGLRTPIPGFENELYQPPGPHQNFADPLSGFSNLLGRGLRTRIRFPKAYTDVAPYLPQNPFASLQSQREDPDDPWV